MGGRRPEGLEPDGWATKSELLGGEAVRPGAGLLRPLPGRAGCDLGRGQRRGECRAHLLDGAGHGLFRGAPGGLRGQAADLPGLRLLPTGPRRGGGGLPLRQVGPGHPGRGHPPRADHTGRGAHGHPRPAARQVQSRRGDRGDHTPGAHSHPGAAEPRSAAAGEPAPSSRRVQAAGQGSGGEYSLRREQRGGLCGCERRSRECEGPLPGPIAAG